MADRAGRQRSRHALTGEQDASSSGTRASRIGTPVTVLSPAPTFRFVTPHADAFHQVARGWDLDFRPLEKPRGRSALVQTMTSDALLSFLSLGARVEQRGASPRNRRTFALLADGAPEIVWCGGRADSSTLMSFDAGGDFEACSPARFAVHTLSVSTEHLESIADEAELGAVQRLGRDARRIQLDPGQAQRLRSALSTVTALIERDPASAGLPEVRETIETDLATGMLRAAVGGAPLARPVPAVARERALGRALEFIEARAAEAPRIADVCRAAGASERTLRYAFAERFDLSPKAYLQAMRLNGVRRELLKDEPGASVSDAANRWGFWHMGQFAADYRRLFGELPSQTRARETRPST